MGASKKLSSSEVARKAALKAHSTTITKERMSKIARKAWGTRKKNLREAYKSGKKKKQ